MKTRTLISTFTLISQKAGRGYIILHHFNSEHLIFFFFYVVTNITSQHMNPIIQLLKQSIKVLLDLCLCGQEQLGTFLCKTDLLAADDDDVCTFFIWLESPASLSFSAEALVSMTRACLSSACSSSMRISMAASLLADSCRSLSSRLSPSAAARLWLLTESARAYKRIQHSNPLISNIAKTLNYTRRVFASSQQKKKQNNLVD